MDEPEKQPKVYLSEQEKLSIVVSIERNLKPSEIARNLGKPITTIRSFIDKYHETGRISNKMGRPASVTQEQRQKIVNDVTLSPRLDIRCASTQEGSPSRETIRCIRHEEGIHFYNEIPRPELTAQHKLDRLNFARTVLASNETQSLVFTDESSITVDLSKGGI